MPHLKKGVIEKVKAAVSSGNRGSLAAQERRVKAMTVGKKNSPERLLRIVRYAAELPVMAEVCRRAGLSTITLRKYLKDSADGSPDSGDGYDMEIEGIKVRFHDWFYAAMNDGVDKVEAAAFELAYGEKEEVLSHHGRVQYKYDPDLLALGFPEGPGSYLLDEITGLPIPETIPLQDPDMLRFILKARRRDVYGDKSSVDHNVRGGVLVVGVTAKTSAELDQRAAEMKKRGTPLVAFREDDDLDSLD